MNDHDQAYQRGRDDFFAGLHLDKNTYRYHTAKLLAAAWNNGWCDAANEYNRKYAGHNEVRT